MHGGEKERGKFGIGGVDFVADGDVADFGGGKVGNDVGLDPCGGVGLEGGAVCVGDAEEELDVGALEAGDGGRVRVVDSHFFYSVGFVELDDVVLRW